MTGRDRRQDDTPKRLAPLLGRHTGEVLEEAGYAPAKIDSLIETGAAK